MSDKLQDALNAFGQSLNPTPKLAPTPAPSSSLLLGGPKIDIDKILSELEGMITPSWQKLGNKALYAALRAARKQCLCDDAEQEDLDAGLQFPDETDAFLLAAAYNAAPTLMAEIKRLRAAPALLSSGGPAAELFAGLDLPLIDGESPITFIRRHGPGLTESNGKAYHAALDRIEKILAAPASTSLGGGAAENDLFKPVSELQGLRERVALFERWVFEKGEAEMSVDEAITVRNLAEMDFSAWNDAAGLFDDDQALIDYEENMPALLGAFAALHAHYRKLAADQLLVDSSGAGNWISVDERLPEMGVEVQLYYGCQLGKGRQTIGKFADVGVNDWGSEPQNVWLNNYEPTHWKPLDPAPADHD